VRAAGEAGAAWNSGRPVRFVTLDGTPAAVLKGSSLGYPVALHVDLSDWFADNFEWIAKALAASEGGNCEICH